MGGQKKALIVGFNYPESQMHIKSPANSATRFTDCLMTYYSFLSDDITLMLDEKPLLNCNFPTNHEFTPFYFPQTTTSFYAFTICTKLYEMITDSGDGDTVIFYFSGHGGRTPATDYNNNSGFVEYMCCSDGSIITDSNLRHITECVPVGCSFTVVADCSASGGLVEGAKEILGHSTKTPQTNKTPLTSNIWEPLGTTRRPLGILLSACQNDQEARAAINFYRLESSCFYTDALLLVIEETKGNVTNWNLVKTIRHMFRSMQWKQTPGLYCDESQMNLNFLGLNGSEVAEKGHSERKINVAKMSKRECILGNPYVYVGEIRRIKKILGEPFIFSRYTNIGDLLGPGEWSSFDVFRAMHVGYHMAFEAYFKDLASMKIQDLESMEGRGKMKDVLKWIASTYIDQIVDEKSDGKFEKNSNDIGEESSKKTRKKKYHDRDEKKKSNDRDEKESSKKKRKKKYRDRDEKESSKRKKKSSFKRKEKSRDRDEESSKKKRKNSCDRDEKESYNKKKRKNNY